VTHHSIMLEPDGPGSYTVALGGTDERSDAEKHPGHAVAAEGPTRVKRDAP
jgi:hypothetical protein